MGIQFNGYLKSENLINIFEQEIDSASRINNFLSNNIYISNKPKQKKKSNDAKDSLIFDDLIRLLEDNNLELRAEKTKLNLAKYNLSIVKTEYNPSLKLSSEGLPKYSIGEGNNPKKESSEIKSSLSATLNFNIYDPVKVHNINLTKNQLSKAEILYDIFKDTLISKTQKLFIDYQLALEKVKIGKQAFLLSKSSLEDANLLNKALLVSDIEVLEAESQLSRDEKFLNDKVNELELIKISLAEILGIDKKEVEKIINTNLILGYWNRDLNETINFAKSNNNELKKLQLELNISNNKSNKELSKSKPNFSFFNRLSSSINQGQSNISQNLDFNKTGSEYLNTVGIKLNWEIFNGGKNKYIRKFKKNKSKEFNLRKKDQENKIIIEVSENFETLKTALKNILNTSNQVKKNQNILEISRLRFNAGVASQREIINNQRDLTQAKIFYANSIATYNKNLIDLTNITNLNSFEKCSESTKIPTKSYESSKDIKLSFACEISSLKDNDNLLDSEEFKLYKNSINKMVEKKKLDPESNAINQNREKKQIEKQIKNEEKIFFEGSDKYDVYDSCEEIDNFQIKANCLDSFL